jgi:hypothetical protein
MPDPEEATLDIVANATGICSIHFSFVAWPVAALSLVFERADLDRDSKRYQLA